MASRVSMLVVAAGVFAVAAIPARSAPTPSVDLKVALRTEKSCGTFGDSLPVLVMTDGFQPDDQSDVVVICLKNRGKTSASITMSVVELSTSDPVCSSGEASEDDTCGGDAAGEIQNVLAQRFALLAKCRDNPVSFDVVEFPRLTGSPLSLGKLAAGQTRCVALRLDYPSTSQDAEASAQTDGLRWRYAFDASG